MNGPQHYAEAERLLALADKNVSVNTVEMTGERKADIIAAAQVHAALAGAAATVDANGVSQANRAQWATALGDDR